VSNAIDASMPTHKMTVSGLFLTLDTL